MKTHIPVIIVGVGLAPILKRSPILKRPPTLKHVSTPKRTPNLLLTYSLILAVALLSLSCGAVVQPQYSIAASWLAPGFDLNGWPTIGHDAAHAGSYPKTTQVLHGHIAWQQDSGGAIFSAPVLANDTLYVGSTGGNLLALDAQTGAVRWQHAIGQFLNDATPVVVGRVVFVSQNRSWISALDTTNGQQLWATDMHEVIKAAPTYADGLILVNATTTTFALDARSGVERWHFHENGNGWLTTAAPAVQGRFVYIAQGTNPILYTLDLLTGHKLWTYNVGDRLISTPLILNQEVIIGTWKGKVQALSTTTGILLWSYDVNQVFPHQTTTDGIAGSPAAANGTVFIGTYNGNILALNTGNGLLQWTRSIDSPVLDVPVVASNTLYVAGGQTLYALAVTNGLPRWSLSLGDVRNDLALGANRLYLGTVQGYIYSVN